MSWTLKYPGWRFSSRRNCATPEAKVESNCEVSVRFALARALDKAGTVIAMMSAITKITTRSSVMLKPRREAESER